MVDLKDMDVEQLCDLFNADEDIQRKAGVCRGDLIKEFISRHISTVNIQRAAGGMCGQRMRIWYNEPKNCIEVRGRHFFEGTNLWQW